MATTTNVVILYKKLSLEEERKLVEAAQEDWAAFEALYNHYVKEIYAYLLKRVRDKDLAEDLTSETFMKAMENINKFEWRGVPFRAWLYRIAVNCANQAYKKNKRVGNIEAEDVARLKDPNQVDPKKEFDLNLEKEKLLAAMEQISEKEQSIITLRYFQDMPYEEIAQIMGMSVNLVGVKIHRILKKLQTRL